jgi:hypothetical protein
LASWHFARTATLLISADAKLIIGRSFEHRTRRFRRLTEDKMGTLVFVCPTTGFEVFTGLEMDQSTFADLPSVLPDIRCPHCPKPHQLSDVTAWLAEGERRTDGIASGETATP